MARLAPGKILVIQTAFLGDLVLTTSFLANLRSLAPHSEIHFLTTPLGTKLLTPNDFGVHPISYDKRGADRGFARYWRLAKRLRAARYGLVFCLHRSFRSATLARFTGGDVYGFREAAGSSLFRHAVTRASGSFEAEKNHRLLLSWAGEAAGGLNLFPRLTVTAADTAEADALLAGARDFVAIAPSSVWATKRWPAEKYAALVQEFRRKHGLSCVLVGGNDAADLAVSKALLAALPLGEPRPLDLTGKTGLGSLKSVLSRARLVVSNDSAPLHVGIAMGTKVLGVFGPTTKELGFFPLAPSGKSATAEVAGLACRPCGLHGHHDCPLGHFKCMRELSVEAVLAQAERLL
jgi:heptosyltransferase-2